MTDIIGSQIQKLKSNLRLVVVIVIVIVIVIIGLAVYLPRPVIEKETELEEEAAPEMPTPEEAGAGPVGEVKIKEETTGEEKPLMTPETPAKIYNTTGEVSEARSDRIIVWGSGTNFADRQQRALTVFVDDETLIFGPGIPLNLKGKEGLKYLKAGDSVLIEGRGNIRGKTEFFADRIKKR